MKTINVLIVEDNRIVGEDIKQRLTQLGYTVTSVATSGRKALASAQQMLPDIALMDIKLGEGMNGIDTAAQLRRKYQIPIIYMTAYADQDTVQRAKKTVPFGYLIKPISDRELQSTLEIALYKHKMERQLKESEKWLETTLNSIGDGVIATDMDARITFINPEAESLTGWSKAEADGRPLQSVFNIIHEHTRQPCANPVEEVIKSGKTISLAQHTVLLNRQGREIPIKDSGALIRLNRRENLGVVLVFQDDTQSRAAKAAISESRERLARFMESATEGFILLDSQLVHVEINRVALDIMGLEHQEVIGKKLEDTVPDIIASGRYAAYKEVMRTGEPFFVHDLTSHPLAGDKHIELKAFKVGDGLGIIITDITQRKQAELRIEQFGRIFEDSLNEIYLFDAHSLIFVQVNQEAQHNLGYSMAMLKNLTPLDLMPEYTADSFAELVAPLRTGQIQKVVIETVYQRKDRSVYPVEVHLQLLKQTLAMSFVAIVLDITDRKRTEQDLLATHAFTKRQNITFAAINRLFREAIDCKSSAEVAKICLSIAEEVTQSKFGSVAEVNRQNRFDTLALSDPGWEACRMARLDPFYVKDMEIRGIWRAALKSEHGLIINDPSNHPLSVGTPDGHPPLFAFLGMPFRHKNFKGMIGIANRKGGYTETDREIIEALTLSFAEVINTKRAEEALRDSENKYRSLFDNAVEGFFQCAPDGRFISVNPAFAKILGYTSAEDLIASLSLGNTTYFIDSEDEKHYRQALKEYGVVENFEFKARRKDGSQIWVSHSTRVHLDVNNEVIRYEGILNDISRRKQAEQEKMTLQTQLTHIQKFESLGNLAGGIAHDFNNILSSILGFTELALDDVDRGSNIEDNLQEVYAAGKRARELVKQILTFARKTDEELKPIQIDIILKEVFRFLRSTIPTSIKLKAEINSDSFIMGNTTQVHQVLMNLCTNAAYAMEEHGGSLTVIAEDIMVDLSEHRHVENWRKIGLMAGPYIRLKVSDTGIGIASDIIDSIFDPYFTTKGLGDGTGMGLALVHGIVESYAGKISVDSILGKGTTFTIYFPITKKRKAHGAYQPDVLPRGTEHILFVDDEAPIVRIGCQILERLGYTVTSQTSSMAALELFRSNPDKFDLVVTDLTMPNMTGDKLAMELMRIRSDLPVILCTGYSRSVSHEHAKKIGIKAFANKPIVKVELAKTVRKVLDRHDV